MSNPKFITEKTKNGGLFNYNNVLVKACKNQVKEGNVCINPQCCSHRAGYPQICFFQKVFDIESNLRW